MRELPPFHGGRQEKKCGSTYIAGAVFTELVNAEKQAERGKRGKLEGAYKDVRD